jgi:hypothetical protein
MSNLIKVRVFHHQSPYPTLLQDSLSFIRSNAKNIAVYEDEESDDEKDPDDDDDDDEEDADDKVPTVYLPHESFITHRVRAALSSTTTLVFIAFANTALKTIQGIGIYKMNGKVPLLLTTNTNREAIKFALTNKIRHFQKDDLISFPTHPHFLQNIQTGTQNDSTLKTCVVIENERPPYTRRIYPTDCVTRRVMSEDDTILKYNKNGYLKKKIKWPRGIRAAYLSLSFDGTVSPMIYKSFVVDTGAENIVLSDQDATQMGLTKSFLSRFTKKSITSVMADRSTHEGITYYDVPINIAYRYTFYETITANVTIMPTAYRLIGHSALRKLHRVKFKMTRHEDGGWGGRNRRRRKRPSGCGSNQNKTKKRTTLRKRNKRTITRPSVQKS